MGSLLNQSDRRAVLDALRPTAVLHLAWSGTQSDNYEQAAENREWATSSISFARECLDSGAWFLAAGSAADTAGDPSFQSPYSAAKRQFRAEAQALQTVGRFTWLRPQYVVSIEDRRPRVVRAYLDRPSGAVLELADPDVELDFIHVGDVASAIAATIENGLTGTVDLGSGSLHSVSELLAAVDRSLDGETASGASSPDRPSATRPDRLFDLGWQPLCTRALFGSPIT